MGRKSNVEKLVESQIFQIEQEIDQHRIAIIKAENTVKNLLDEKDRLKLIQNEIQNKKENKDE